MATEFTKLTRCAGGGHLTYEALVDGKLVRGVLQVADLGLPAETAEVQKRTEAVLVEVVRKTPTAKTSDLMTAANARASAEVAPVEVVR